MRNVWTIARREYKLYFVSPIAYIVALIIFLTVGILFLLNIISASNYRVYGYAPDATIVTGPLATLFMLTAPAITMRLLSEEQRSGTSELLLTAPVQDWELVIGKWLGSFLFVATIILATLIFPLVLSNLVEPGIDLPRAHAHRHRLEPTRPRVANARMEPPRQRHPGL